MSDEHAFWIEDRSDEPPSVQELYALLVRPDWQRDALCVEYPEVDFFPTKFGKALAAKKICARCLVRDECLSFALLREPSGGRNRHGVFGGLTAAERQRCGEAVMAGADLAALTVPVDCCKRGHPWTPENTRVKDGKRNCRACQREYGRRRAANRAANPGDQGSPSVVESEPDPVADQVRVA